MNWNFKIYSVLKKKKNWLITGLIRLYYQWQIIMVIQNHSPREKYVTQCLGPDGTTSFACSTTQLPWASPHSAQGPGSDVNPSEPHPWTPMSYPQGGVWCPGLGLPWCLWCPALDWGVEWAMVDRSCPDAPIKRSSRWSWTSGVSAYTAPWHTLCALGHLERYSAASLGHPYSHTLLVF